jgi:hypothetical protein
MAKSREHVVTNGRAAFYACVWNDLRQAALDCGWALALHGSLNSDMDIMAMPWTEDAKTVDVMIGALRRCFTDNELMIPQIGGRPNGRIVFSLPIFGDFYLDVNVIMPTASNQIDEVK